MLPQWVPHPVNATLPDGRNQAYLLPVLDRPNLKVLTEAPVTRLVTETVGGELVTTAVEFERGGTVHRVLVGKEAILCAG